MHDIIDRITLIHCSVFRSQLRTTYGFWIFTLCWRVIGGLQLFLLFGQFFSLWHSVFPFSIFYIFTLTCKFYAIIIHVAKNHTRSYKMLRSQSKNLTSKFKIYCGMTSNWKMSNMPAEHIRNKILNILYNSLINWTGWTHTKWLCCIDIEDNIMSLHNNFQVPYPG